MTAERVRLERNADIAVITVDRPEARNALTAAMKEQLIEFCAELRDDPGIRAVAVRGAGGKSFASGADIKEMAGIDTVDGFMEQARLVDSLYDAIESIPQPTVAVIEGFALGSGLFIALACDLRLCTPDSRVGAPAAAMLGNCLSSGEYALLVGVVGPTRALELILQASVLTAERAESMGIVTEVVERSALEQRVDDLLRTLASHAPLAMWAAKESVHRIASAQQVNLDDVLARVLSSADFHEGRMAFTEKRPPRWRNA